MKSKLLAIVVGTGAMVMAAGCGSETEPGGARSRSSTASGAGEASAGPSTGAGASTGVGASTGAGAAPSSTSASASSGMQPLPPGSPCNEAAQCQGYACYCTSIGFAGCVQVCSGVCQGPQDACDLCGGLDDTFDHAEPAPNADCP